MPFLPMLACLVAEADRIRGEPVIEWSEHHEMIRDALRRFSEQETLPKLEAFEHGDLPPLDILRKKGRRLA